MRIIDKLVNNNDKFVSFANFANEYYNFHKGNWTNYFDQAKNNLIALANVKVGAQQNLVHVLINDLESIIKATPSQIPTIISKFTTGVHANIISGNTLPIKTFRKEVEEAFNYSAFRKSAKASWFAERFEIKACLYCNAQFSLAIGKDGTKKKKHCHSYPQIHV